MGVEVQTTCTAAVREVWLKVTLNLKLLGIEVNQRKQRPQSAPVFVKYIWNKILFGERIHTGEVPIKKMETCEDQHVRTRIPFHRRMFAQHA